MQPPQPQPRPQQPWPPYPEGRYPYPAYYPPPRSTDTGKTILIVVIVIGVVLVGTIVMAAVLYVLVSGTLTGPTPPPNPGPIGISRQDTSSAWVLVFDSVPQPHSLTTTTFLMRWGANSSIVNPPGQATLEVLKIPSGGVVYQPVTGAAQQDLRVLDSISISKSFSYSAGMHITIADGSSILWAGVL